MRKLTLILVAMALVLSVTCNAFAAGASLTVADMPAKADETVYLSVSLNGTLTADAIGVRYSYDSALLEPLPDSSIWDVSGSLSDFSQEDSGVWANAQSKELTGRLFTLAFRLKEGVTLTESSVSCTVVFKNGESSSTELTATGKVYTVCDHTYSDWANAGQLDHSRTCTLCGKKQSQTHTWNSGTTADHPSNPSLDIVTYTCTVCGATRSAEVTGEAVPVLPTVPQPTEPSHPTEPAPTLPPVETIPAQTEPVTNPTVPQPSFGKPENEQNSGSTQKPGNTTQPTTPSQPAQPTQPSQPSHSEQPAPGHSVTDYNQSASQNSSGNSGQNNTGNSGQNNAGSSNQSGTNSTAPTTGTSSNTESNQSGAPGSTDQSGEVSQTPAQTHNHSGNQQAVAVPIPTEHPLLVNPVTEPEQEHDHDHLAETQPVSAGADSSGTFLSSGLALLAAVAAIFGAAGLSLVLIRRIRSDKKKKS